ncbi:EGF-like and EMI domain-containing protein 1 [Vulpes lagopus]
MDPCTGGNGYAHICQSENGVARCVCRPGYQLSEDKKACGDLDECESGEHCCAQLCVVVDCLGSYEALDDGKLEEEREN